MNEPPKNVWKQPWRGRKAFTWFALLVGATFLMICGTVLLFGNGKDNVTETVLGALILAVCLGVLATLALLFIRWLCCWRNLKRLLFGVACLLTLIALAHVIENVRGHYAWSSLQQAAAAKGERFDLASVIPPPVPDAENFALASLFEGLRHEMDPDYRRAHTGPGGLTNENRFALNSYRTNGSSADVSLGSWMKAEKTDLRAWQDYYRTSRVDLTTREFAAGAPEAFAQRYGLGPPLMAANQPDAKADTNAVVYEFPVAPLPQSPAADVLLALSKFNPVVEELREASGRPHSRFPLRYEDGFNMLLPHLARLKGASQFLALRSVAELEAGQAERALADVRLSFRLVDCTRTEPNLISHLVRIAQIHLALQPVWEGLADHQWNEAQLAALDAELASLDFLADHLTAMRGERVCSIAAVEHVRRKRDPSVFLDVGGPPGRSSTERLLSPLLWRVVPGGWFDQNKALAGRLHLELFLPAVDQQARTVPPAALRRADDALQKALSPRTPYNFFAGLLLPALTRATEKFARGQASVDLARVACALERHRLAHGQYPQTLDALTPRFLAKLPHDVINGQPLKYRRTDDGRFLLHSVGWNETDDGGQVALTSKGSADWNKGDWVWRYPAK